MDTLAFLAQKFDLDLTRKSPIPIYSVNRTIMAQTLRELEFTVGAEVGVAQGFHAEMLCRENPQAKLFAVDIWEPYAGYIEYVHKINAYYKEAQKRLAPYHCEMVKKTSVEAARSFADSSLDFVYIDAAHDFKNVAIDLCEWSRKVRPGGIVFGHDYERLRRRSLLVQVKDVVQAFVYAHHCGPLFELHNHIRDPKFGVDAPGFLFVRREDDLTAWLPSLSSSQA